MTISPSDSKIFGPLFSHPAIDAIFTDGRFIGEMLQVETALAGVLAELELIPAEAATRIAEAASGFQPDLEQLRLATQHSGVPVIELVRQLRERVGNLHGRYVHWGATSQDIMDTARVLQIRAALAALEAELEVLIIRLAELADQHRKLVMAGRTHSQQALPITFGYKVATWLAPLLRHRDRLDELRPRVLVLQFGGAAGTLAAYHERGEAVSAALSETLELAPALLPWHTQRDGFAELAGWLSLLSGSLAKLAQDVILLAQSEVAELRESAAADRGSSSSMPQKVNPIQSELIIAAARANAALLSSMHQALVQEHERATHGWQLEWFALPQMFALTGSALAKARTVATGLQIDAERMRRNLEAAHGTLMAEAIRLALTEHLAADEAEALVREACQIALAEGRPLAQVVSQHSELELDWEALTDESRYLGSIQSFIDRVLERAAPDR